VGNINSTKATQTIKSLLDNDGNVTINVNSGYITIGTDKYLFSGDATTSAAVVAEATALHATPLKGSIYLGAGILWGFDSDLTATKIDWRD
jgi:hypothetical protein